MKAQKIRCKNDMELFEKLSSESIVADTNEKLRRYEEDHPSRLRRKLLSTSVRLSEGMGPGIHNLAKTCINKLEVDISVELYVYPSPSFNAACFKPEDDRLFVMFSSSLLESFNQKELQFVLGHELGHHIYKHHDIPIGYLLNQDKAVDPELVLELFTWSRYAEISADRAGAHCCHDLYSAAKALFKLASGLSGRSIVFSLDDFLDQVEDMAAADHGPGVGAPQEDWFTTHPFSPLRVKALKLFYDSKFERNDGISETELEVAVQEILGMMEPSYIEGKTEAATHMRRLLYGGAIAVADASDGVAEEEVAIFEKFFGKGELSKNLDVPRIKEDLPNRIKKALEYTTKLQRMQVIRDLCLVARASGTVTKEEVQLLQDISRKLNISTSFLKQTLYQNVEPD